MLQKRRMIASIPDGLNRTTEEMKKGRLAVRKYNSATGEFELSLPASAEEAVVPYGFVTLRIDEDTHNESYYDVIQANKLAVAYTLVPNESWGTTEFTGTPAVGDKMTVAFDGTNKGKLKKVTTGDTNLFEVVAVYPAMGGYEEAMIDVRVL